MAKKQDVESKEVVYTVKPGDTAWRVAERLAKQYEDRRDVREILFYAKGLNKKYIEPGDQLVFVLEVPKHGQTY